MFRNDCFTPVELSAFLNIDIAIDNGTAASTPTLECLCVNQSTRKEKRNKSLEDSMTKEERRKKRKQRKQDKKDKKERKKKRETPEFMHPMSEQ